MSSSASGSTKGAGGRSGVAVLTPLLPLLVWVLAIHVFSTDAFSSGETSRYIEPFLRAIFPKFAPEQIDFMHAALRNCRHGAEYFVLGLLAYRALRARQTDLVKTIVRAGAFVLLVALTDEFHQMFTASRGPSLMDLGYDCLGGV